MSDGKFDEMLKKALREACMQDAEVMFSSGFIVPSAALLHRQEKMLKKPAAYAKKIACQLGKELSALQRWQFSFLLVV